MAMFPQFFTHPSLYSNLFRANNSSSPSSSSPNAFASQLAFFNSAAFQQQQQQAFQQHCQQHSQGNASTQFFVDNFLRERAAAAAAAAAAALVAAANHENAQQEFFANRKCSPASPELSSKCSNEQSLLGSQPSPASATEHESDRNSDDSNCARVSRPSSPVNAHPNKSSPLKFGVNAILSNDSSRQQHHHQHHQLLSLKGKLNHDH